MDDLENNRNLKKKEPEKGMGAMSRLPRGGEKAEEDGGTTSRDTEQPQPSGDSQQERPAVSL